MFSRGLETKNSHFFGKIKTKTKQEIVVKGTQLMVFALVQLDDVDLVFWSMISWNEGLIEVKQEFKMVNDSTIGLGIQKLKKLIVKKRKKPSPVKFEFDFHS